MAKKRRADDKGYEGAETTGKKEPRKKGPIESEIERISAELGGYGEMVKKLVERDPTRFEGFNKSTFSYWIRQEQDKKAPSERLGWAMEILGKPRPPKETIKFSYVDNIWNLPATLVCWQPSTLGTSPVPDFHDLKAIGLGKLSNLYEIVAEFDDVNSGTEALERLRDDSGCSIAIVASDLVNKKKSPLKAPLYRLCPISRTQIEGITRGPVDRLDQLRGQRLGYPDGSAVAEVVSDFFEKRAKKPPIFVELLDNAAATAALRSGEIRGVLGWQPQLGGIKAEAGSEIDLHPIPVEFLPRMELEVVINYEKIRPRGLLGDFLSAIRMAVEGIEQRKRWEQDKFAAQVADLLGVAARGADPKKSIMRAEDVKKSLGYCRFSVPYIYADVAIRLYADMKRPGDTDV